MAIRAAELYLPEIMEDFFNSYSYDSERVRVAKISFESQEPWTGVWEVEGSPSVVGMWGLQQSGNTIVSDENSTYKIKGRVEQEFFKGKLKALGTASYYFSIKVKIASDGQSFRGIASDPMGRRTIPIRGYRKK